MKNRMIVILVGLFSSMQLFANAVKPTPARSILVNCHNQTDINFKWASGEITHGIVSHHDVLNKDLYPPMDIEAHSTVQWATESDGLMTGTEGHVSYQILDDNGSNFYFHWDSPYKAQSYDHFNLFNETISEGYIIFISGDHRQYNEVVDLYIGYPKTVVVKDFLPSSCGFRFANSWEGFGYKIPWLKGLPIVGDLKIGNASNGLCGGMVYTVRDYFEEKYPIAKIATAPNDPENKYTKYIIERLFNSFDINDITMYLKLTSKLYPDIDEGGQRIAFGQMGRAYITLREEWPMIKNDIDMGHPSPIGLIRIKSNDPSDLGKNHQVLVYGYSMNTDAVELKVYDPNFPSNDSLKINLKLLGMDKPLAAAYNGDSNPIYAFFRTNYSARKDFLAFHQYVKVPKIMIPSKGGGLITGAIRWRDKTGFPKTNNINDAFKVSVFIPKYFQPMPEAEVTLEEYQGQKGYFDDIQQTGEANIILNSHDKLITAGTKNEMSDNNQVAAIGVKTVDSGSGNNDVMVLKGNQNADAKKDEVVVFNNPNSNVWEYKLMISGVPLNVPFIVTIECSNNVVWEWGNDNPKPQGSKEYVYVININSVSSGVMGKIDLKTGMSSGADFECTGEWRVFNPNTKGVLIKKPVQNKKIQGQLQKINKIINSKQ